ncbi:MAG TPA: DUF3501 family protein [Polyangiaceae bacterium]|nr:DUF3501 family protein [Polyangiaceae bacterium]
MKPVERSEILELGEYEEVREHFRRRVIELKRLRRVAVGGNLTVLFENRDTVLYQIQEMIRTERITREDAILHEIETYNELLPSKNELSATIFIEFPERTERERMLVELAGVEDKFYLEVDGERTTARNETRGVRPDRTTAVHYVKYPLGDAAARSVISKKANVVLGVDHPAYRAEAALVRRTLEEIATDLA